MKKIIGTLLLIVFGFLAIFLLVRLNVGTLKHDSLITGLEQNIKTVVSNHLSMGTRVGSSGTAITDLPAFEKDFNEMMKEYSTSNVINKDTMLEYIVLSSSGKQEIVALPMVKHTDLVKGVKISYVHEDKEFNLRYILEELQKGKTR